MAITKTHSIKSTLNLAIQYICNPAKTDGTLLVSSFACLPATADIEFEWTRRQAIDKGNSLRKAVIAGETNGHGYGILSSIAQNAIRVMRDMQLRPEAYSQAEEELKILLADLITDVQNGKDYIEAVKEAYSRIYQSVDASFNYDEQFSLDTCYRDIPAVGMEKFTVARKLLLEAKSTAK